MGEKDITEKALISCNDVFADIVNNLAFGGRKRIAENDHKAFTLHEALGDKLKIEFKELVQDYAINLYEIAYLTDDQLQGFQSDFKYVADYFMQKQRTGTYTGSHEEMKHVREVLQLMAVLTGDNRFATVTVSETEDGEKGEIHCMCDVLDAIEKRGYDTGYDSGYGEGKESQAKEDAIGMYRKGMVTTDIAEITGTSVETVLDWLSDAVEL